MNSPRPADWAEMPLESVCTVYDGPHATPTKMPDGPVFLGISCLSNGRIDLSDAAHLSEDDFARWTRRITPQPGDVVFSYETRLGEAALIPEGLRCCLGRRMGLLRPNRDRVEPRFLLYLYLSPSFQETLASRTVPGSTVDRISISEMPSFPISMPPLRVQRAIARILGSLDDKIELNQRMNETLEAMARAIFKSWFVDFDPVRAKMDGGQPAGMDPATAALFPETFEDSELGEIPKGWSVGTIGDVVTIHDSKRIPLSSRERAERKGTYRYYGATGILDWVDDYLFDGIYLLVGEDGSVIGSDDHPVVQYVWGQFWVSNHAHVLSPRPPVGTEQLLLFLNDLIIRPYVTGAVQPKLNQANLKSVPFVVADERVCSAFSRVVGPLYSLYRTNAEESLTLVAIRDALLPKLLSGEIRVSDDSRSLEGAPWAV